MPVQFPHKIINLDEVGNSVLLDRHYQWVDVIGTPDADFDLWLPPAELPGCPMTIKVHPEDGSGRIRLRPQAGKQLCGGDFHRFPILGPSSSFSHSGSLVVSPNINPATNKPSGNWMFMGGELVQFGLATTNGVSVNSGAVSTLAPFNDALLFHESYSDQWNLTNASFTPPCAATFAYFIVFTCTGFAAGEHFWSAITAPGGIFYETSFSAIGGITERFTMGGTLSLIEGVSYGLACYHNGAAARTIQGEVQIRRLAG